MPGSFIDHIPAICHAMMSLAPDSVLDVGTGFGKWGHLFREILDISHSEDAPERYHKSGWKVRIDGIEGYAQYLTPMHRYLYDTIHEGNMLEVIDRLDPYDAIFMGDVIEHVTKADGQAFLDKLLAKANKAVILSTPAWDIPQGASCGNELEVHRSFWTASDFERFPNKVIRIVAGRIMVVVLLKPGVPAPRFGSPLRGYARLMLHRLRGATKAR